MNDSKPKTMNPYPQKTKFSILATIFFCVTFFISLTVNAQWVAQVSGTSSDLYSSSFIEPNIGWVVGANGTMLKTVDGGSTWTSLTSNTTDSLKGISFISSTTGYAAGEEFRNMKTTDGGTSWDSRYYSINKNINSIHAFNSSTVVGVGENIVFKTTNSFSNINYWGSFGIQNCLFYVNYSTGWMVGNSGEIYKLTGTISSFSNQTSGTTEDLLGVHFVNTSVGYVVGKNGTILKTTNGGSTWTSLTSGVAVNLNSVFFTDANTGYAIGDNETILKTIDGGNNWTIQMSGTNTSQHHHFVWFTDTNNGWIVGANGAIYHTANGGEAPVGIASKPSGPNSRCETPATYTASAVNATSYIWSLQPSSSGTITGSGTTATVMWNNNYTTNSTITAQGINGTEQGSVSNPLIVYGNPSAFSLSAPQNGDWVSATPLFEWTASEGANTYSLYIDGTLIKENITSTNYQLLPEESISSGMHTWYVVASNGCTTQSNETRSFLVDDTPPSAFNLTSPTDNSWTTNLQPTLEWNASGDAQSGLQKYQLWIDGELNRDDIPVSASSTTPASSLTNGSHTWEIRAVDNVGNVRKSTQSRTIKVDNIPPGNIDNCAFFDGSDHYAESTNGVAISNRITMEAWVRPKCGNNTDRGVLDTGPTYFSIDDNNLLKYRYYRGSNMWSGSFLSNSSLPCNTWTHIAVTHNSLTGIIKFYINGELDVIHTNGYAVIDGTSLFTMGRAKPNGGYGWRYFYGNIDEARIWNTVRSGNEIQQNINKVLEGTCQSNLLAYYSMNDPYSSSLLEDFSSHNNNANLINGANVEKSTKENEVLGGLSDLKVPECSEYVQTNKPAFYWCKAPDEGVGFEKFQLFIDNNLVEDNLSDSSVTITNPLAYGEHNWFVKGFDSLGNNQSSYSRKFYVDNVPPNPFSLTTPADSQIVNLPTPDLSWEATLDSAGGSGMSKYQLWINGETDIDSIPIGTTTTSPSSVLPQGEYSWFIKAHDNVGNIRQSSETRIFYVDWEPPQDFTLIAPADNDTVSSSRPLFQWHSSLDIGSGIDKYELWISGFSPITVPATDTAVQPEFQLPEGSYTWYVKAFDKAGASTSSNTNTLEIEFPSQQSELEQGWNIVSFYVTPIESGLQGILQPVIDNDNLIKAIDEQGNIIEEMAWGWVDNIGDMSPSEGYYVKVSAEDSLSTSGGLATLPYDISLTSGWNMTGYPAMNSQDASEVLSELMDSNILYKVIDQAGNIIENMPWGWVNNIGTFTPGEGYSVKVNQDATLTIEEPANRQGPLAESYKAPKAEYFSPVYQGNPFEPMQVVVDAKGLDLSQGDELALYSNNQCVGAAGYNPDSPYQYLTASKNDNQTAEQDGYQEGSAITLKVYRKATGTSYQLLTETIEGPSTYSPLATLITEANQLTTDSPSANTDKVRLHQNRPNPFTDKTEISYYLPEAGKVSLNIYDLHGQQRALVVNHNQKAGHHEETFDASQLSPGVYIYKLTYQNQQTQQAEILLRKMTILK